MSQQEAVAQQQFLDAPPFPKMVQFETNTTCNASCLMCPHDKLTRHGSAKWSTITKLIREVAPYVEMMVPFLMQEPFLEPRLPAILANIKQRNSRCATSIYSNMSYCPENMAKQILVTDLLDELHISFYGPTEELYAKWQPPLNRADTVANIQRWFNLRKKLKRLKPSITLHRLSIQEIIDASAGYSDIAGYVDKVGNVQYDTFCGAIPDVAGDQSKFMGRQPSPRVPCQRVWSLMIVQHDGTVVPCCLDYNQTHPLGNICVDTPQEIWRSLPYERLRRLHRESRWSDIPLCQKCTAHQYNFTEEWVKYWINLKEK